MRTCLGGDLTPSLSHTSSSVHPLSFGHAPHIATYYRQASRWTHPANERESWWGNWPWISVDMCWIGYLVRGDLDRREPLHIVWYPHCSNPAPRHTWYDNLQEDKFHSDLEKRPKWYRLDLLSKVVYNTTPRFE